jgi:hypothetical protein
VVNYAQKGCAKKFTRISNYACISISLHIWAACGTNAAFLSRKTSENWKSTLSLIWNSRPFELIHKLWAEVENKQSMKPRVAPKMKTDEVEGCSCLRPDDSICHSCRSPDSIRAFNFLQFTEDVAVKTPKRVTCWFTWHLPLIDHKITKSLV